MIRLRRGDVGRGTRLELSPLAVVLFALLGVFFAGIAVSRNRHAVPVDIGYHGGADADVVILVTGNDAYFWNRDGPLPVAGVGEEMKRRRPVAGFKGIVVQGDHLALFGDVVRVYDELRAAGETRVGLQTRVAPTP